jgi:hypothetical protein
MKTSWIVCLGSLALMASAPGCSEPTQSGAAVSARLPDGVVAAVGDASISADTVKRIAQAQGVATREARELAIRDALFAAGARDALAGFGLVRSVERTVLARSLLEHLKREVRNQPVTDAEIAETTKRQWVSLDRPPSARTTHAVVRVSKPEQDEAAHRLADRIAAAVAGATEPEVFMQRARQVPAGKLVVTIERLPPVTADGRVVDFDAPPGAPTGRFDLDFARAANGLREVGEHSPVVRSKFGFHVILLEERVPARHVPLPQRRKLLRDEIMDQRAGRLTAELVERTRRTRKVEVSRAALDLTARVQVKR